MNRASTDRRKSKRAGALDRRYGKRTRAPRPSKAVEHTRKARALRKKGAKDGR